MKTKMAIALMLSILFSASAIAGDIYRWTNPETGEILATTTPPPYPIKEKRVVGRLPNGDMVELIFDSNAPEIKALVEKRKIREAEQAAREAKQKKIAEEKEKQQAAMEREQEQADPLATHNFSEKEAREIVLTILKDPDSARFGKFTVFGEKACLTVNAKNSMGGYTGDQQAVLKKTKGKWVFLFMVDIPHDMCIEFSRNI